VLSSLDSYCIPSSATLAEAMRQMTTNRKGLLFVLDREDRLVGILSDGDLRRAMLADALLITPVTRAMNPDPITLDADDRERARALVSEKGILAVPILDASRRLAGAIFEDQGGLVHVARGIAPR
jgi:arabinose-5-phosphate isomerase